MADEKPTTSHRALYRMPVVFDSGFLKVSDIHQIYYEQSGKKDGNPVIFLHGGPGSGSCADHHRFFDPDKYRVIVTDQRGCGKSTPAGELRENTTWDLVSDIETLREKLGIDRWVVFGGSWGATLALAYAETHPEKVKAMVIRGIFTSRRKEVTFETGLLPLMFPEYYEKLLEPIPQAERLDLLRAYYRYLTGEDSEKRLECAKAWVLAESSSSSLLIDPNLTEKVAADETVVTKARIECHYFINDGFFKPDSYLLDNVDKIRHIPTIIIQARYDCVCPMETAWELHKKWPEAEFHIVPDAGHSSKEPGVQTLLLDSADKFGGL